MSQVNITLSDCDSFEIETSEKIFPSCKNNDYLSIEYVHQNYMMTVYDDVLSETIKMRDLYNTWKGS